MSLLLFAADSMLYQTAFLNCEADLVLGAVQRRIASLVCLPVDAHQETMISQYTALAQAPEESVTNLHHDHNGNPQRTCTVLVYLNKFDTDVGGGGTFFPCANLEPNEGPCPLRVLRDCYAQHHRVLRKKTVQTDSLYDADVWLCDF